MRTREELKAWVKETRFERLGCFTYSHEENTHAHQLVDDVPEEEKQRRSSEIMELQSQISWELNQEKLGETLRCIIDRKERNFFVGRSEMDSPDGSEEILPVFPDQACRPKKKATGALQLERS